MQINPLIKNCFIERAYKSNNTFGKFPLEVKIHNIKEKRGSESRENPENKNLISWQKNLINKTRSKFWGVTTLPPLRKISSSRFVKSCNDDARIKGLCLENAYIRSNNSGKRNILENMLREKK